MKVMSSLFYLMLTLLPQFLGQEIGAFAAGMPVVKDQNYQRPILFKLNSQSLHKPESMNHIFTDFACKRCVKCMEKALAADGRFKISIETPSDILFSNAIVTHRHKRSASASDINTRMKRPKTQPSTVVKYTSNGLLSAIKVKGSVDGQPTCEVFAVASAYDCDSPEAAHLTGEAPTYKKYKVLNTKHRYSAPAAFHTTSRYTEQTVSKREADHSQIPDNVALSFEEYF